MTGLKFAAKVYIATPVVAAQQDSAIEMHFSLTLEVTSRYSRDVLRSSRSFSHLASVSDPPRIGNRIANPYY